MTGVDDWVTPSSQAVADDWVTPSSGASAPKALERQTYLDAREPSFSERLADWTGSSPQYTARVVEALKAPYRMLQGAEAPYQGVAEGLPRAAAYATSLGGTAPNALSRGLGSVADAEQRQILAQEEQRANDRSAAGFDPNDVDYPHAIGNALSPLNATTAEAAAPLRYFLQRRMGGMLGNGVVPRMAQATATGAAIGGEQPATGNDYNQEKLSNVEGGALAGGLIEGAATGISPWINRRAARLADAGVPTTLGMNAGPTASRLEEITQSVPGSGMAVRAARERANEGLNRVVANRALDEIGESVNPHTDPGRDMMKEVNGKIDRSYDQVHQNMNGALDPDLINDLVRIRNGLPARVQQDFEDIVNKTILDRSDPNTLNIVGRNNKKIDIDLRDKSISLWKGDTWEQDLAKGLREARDSVRDMWDRHNPQDLTDKLKATDRAFALARIMENASAHTGAPDGVFNAAHLASAVKNQDITTGKRAFTTGDARLSQLADDAKYVMGSKIGDSYTPERTAYLRVLEGLGALGTAGGALSGIISPAQMGALGAHALTYTPWGQNALRYLANGHAAARNALADRMRAIAPNVIASPDARNALIENSGLPKP